MSSWGSLERNWLEINQLRVKWRCSRHRCRSCRRGYPRYGNISTIHTLVTKFYIFNI